MRSPGSGPRPGPGQSQTGVGVTEAGRSEGSRPARPGAYSFAQALFDNDAESPEELPFHRGDVLGVLTQDLQGLQGWWLCSLNGMQGIAPANRLRLLHSRVLPAQAHSLAVDSSDYQEPMPSWIASCTAPTTSAFPAHFEDNSMPPQTLSSWSSYYYHRKPGIVQGPRPAHLHPTNNSIYEVPSPVHAMAKVHYSPMAYNLNETDYDVPNVNNVSSYHKSQPTIPAWKTDDSDYDIPVSNNRRVHINSLSSSCGNPTSVKSFSIPETYSQGSKDGELPKADMPREKETISLQGHMNGASLRSQSSSDRSLPYSCGNFEPYKVHSDGEETPSKVHNYVDDNQSRPRGYMDENMLGSYSHMGETPPGPHNSKNDGDKRPSNVHNYVDEKLSRPRGCMDENLFRPFNLTGGKPPGPENCRGEKPSGFHCQRIEKPFGYIGHTDEKPPGLLGCREKEEALRYHTDEKPPGLLGRREKEETLRYMDEKPPGLLGRREMEEALRYMEEKPPGLLGRREKEETLRYMDEKPSGLLGRREMEEALRYTEEKPPGLLGRREKEEDQRDLRYHTDEDPLNSQDCKDSDYDTPPQVTRDLPHANTHLGKSPTLLECSVTSLPESHTPYPSELPSTCNELLTHQPQQTPRFHRKMDSSTGSESTAQAECVRGVQKDLKLQAQQEYKREERQQHKGKTWERAVHLNMLDFYTEQCCGQHALLQSAAAALNRACEPSAGPPDTRLLLQLARTLLLAGHGVLFVGDAACRFAVTPNLHDTLLGATRALFGALRVVAARAREAPARLRVRDPDALSRLTSSISELARRTHVLLRVLDEAGNTSDGVIVHTDYNS
uniref:uncharacterized protein n=1 Tax=Myxine glutinosa TaxID=7769 RepID=UPI00358F3FCD